MTAHDHTEYVGGCFRCDLSREEVAAKVERSSLGTPEAQALRATVSDEHAASIVARAKELERDEEVPDWAVERITEDEEALLVANNGPAAGYSGAFVRVQPVVPQPDLQTYANMVAKLPYLVGNDFLVLCVRNRDPLHVLTVHKDSRVLHQVMTAPVFP